MTTYGYPKIYGWKTMCGIGLTIIQMQSRLF